MPPFSPPEKPSARRTNSHWQPLPMMRCSRVGSVGGIFIHPFYRLICVQTNLLVALHANPRLKQLHNSETPSQSNISVGDNAARKTTNLSISHLFGDFAHVF